MIILTFYLWSGNNDMVEVEVGVWDVQEGATLMVSLIYISKWLLMVSWTIFFSQTINKRIDYFVKEMVNYIFAGRPAHPLFTIFWCAGWSAIYPWNVFGSARNYCGNIGRTSAIVSFINWYPVFFRLLNNFWKLNEIFQAWM